MQEDKKREQEEIAERWKSEIENFFNADAVKDSEFYMSSIDSNGKFSPRTPKMMKDAARKSAQHTQERFKRSVQIPL